MGNSALAQRLDYSVYFLFIVILFYDKILIINLSQRFRFHTGRLIWMQGAVTMVCYTTAKQTVAPTGPL